ncbi:MAG: outer membrane beta-barrel protein [Bacteroidetes bacterium]|nr:outer membrane beta-barrel protein [Bacteroidota bacterium]
MKQSLRCSILFMVLSVMYHSSFAQNIIEMNVGYDVSTPTSAFKNYITNTSFSGFNASIDYVITSQWRVGVAFSYNDYYQKYPRAVYSEGNNTSVSAVLSNSVQQLPIMTHANYTIIDKGIVRPYVGAGAGVNFITFDQYLGEFDGPVSKAKFVAQGEAGVFIPLSHYSTTAIKIGGTYNLAAFNEYGTKNLNSWGIQAGIRFPLH